MSVKNSVQFIGHIGQDAETKTLEGGRNVSTFSIATDESYTAKDGTRKEATAWHNVELWGNDGLVPYLKKGTQVAVEGALAHTTYEKIVGGETIKITRSFVKAREVQLLGKSKAAENA